MLRLPTSAAVVTCMSFLEYAAFLFLLVHAGYVAEQLGIPYICIFLFFWGPTSAYVLAIGAAIFGECDDFKTIKPRPAFPHSVGKTSSSLVTLGHCPPNFSVE